MIKIVALNNSDEDETVTNVVANEVQETIAENEYIRALKLKSEGEIDLCLNLLQELLQTNILNENVEINPKNKLCIIKYNCHKNIAFILEKRCEYLSALQHYISAILIDSTDVSTLYKFGQLALKVNATDLAEYAFENCLRRNSEHWSATEGMLQVMSIDRNIIGSYKWARKMCEKSASCGKATKTIEEIQSLFKKNLFFLNKCCGVETNNTLN